jgi:hypothetical protein
VVRVDNAYLFAVTPDARWLVEVQRPKPIVLIPDKMSWMVGGISIKTRPPLLLLFF